MRKINALTKTLAITGTILVWIPVLAPVLFSISLFIQRGAFHFDYLFPAEAFPIALAGGLMLIWASIRAKSHQKLIGWAFVAFVVLPFAGQAVASVTGLATGEVEPVGWQMMLLIAAITAFILAVIAAGVGGILLIRDLFRKLPLEE
jgi:hypothetical protein